MGVVGNRAQHWPDETALQHKSALLIDTIPKYDGDLFTTHLDVIIVRYVCIDAPGDPTGIVYEPATVIIVRKSR
jgi:hypothetical protein